MLKRIFSYMKQYKKYAFLALFCIAVEAVLEEGARYGTTDLGQGKKVMVEFVSANPTGPMHLGNARGGALGDCLASVLRWAGYDVTREFYINARQPDRKVRQVPLRPLPADRAGRRRGGLPRGRLPGPRCHRQRQELRGA